METDKINKVLRKFVTDFGNGLKNLVPVKTGKLRDSIEVKITETDTMFEGQILADDYIEDQKDKPIWDELFNEAVKGDVLDEAVGQQMDEIIIKELTKNGGKLK